MKLLQLQDVASISYFNCDYTRRHKICLSRHNLQSCTPSHAALRFAQTDVPLEREGLTIAEEVERRTFSHYDLFISPAHLGTIWPS
jgi:hypothetical protein